MKKTTNLIFLLGLLVSLIVLSTSTSRAQAVRPMSNSDTLISAQNLINPDGTIRLGGSFSGSVELDGWNVQLDKQRGPVFTDTNRERTWLGSQSLSVGDWANLGSNGSGDGSLNSWVFAIAVNGPDVYVGGWFTDVNNNGTVLNAADYIVKWDGANWSALGSNGAGNGSLNGFVNTIEVSGSNVYVGGSFQNVNNHGSVLNAADWIAKWDGTNWSSLGNNGAGNGSISCCDVMAIAADGSNVYVGGNFMNVNNNGTVLSAADGIAKWDGSNWSALGSDGLGDGSLNSWVSAIALSGSDIYVGGPFTDVNNNGVVLNTADYIAKWDGTNWSSLGSNGTGDGSLNWWVNTIVASGSDLYVGGGFTDVSNNGITLTTADYITKWDGVNWSALGSNGAGNGSINSKVETIAVNGTDIYVGGWFWDVNNNGTVLGAGDRLAKWDGSNWSAIGSNGSGNGSFIGPINAIALTNSNIYVGGNFNDVNNNGSILYTADKIATAPYQVTPTFIDVPINYWAYESIERLFAAGITGGCSTNPLRYCPENTVSRAQMAVFLEKGMHFPANYTPPNLSPTFADTIGHWAEDWIEALRSDGITGGCGTNLYCPENPVTRAQMAVFLLKSKYGPSYTPPSVGAGTGFTDVPTSHWAAAWIKQLAVEGITGGCGAGIYCPDSSVTRAQMAVFLVKTFNLP